VATRRTGCIDPGGISRKAGALSSHPLKNFPAITLASMLFAATPVGAQQDVTHPLSDSSPELHREKDEINLALQTLPHWIPSSQQHGQIGFHGIPTSSSFILVDMGREIAPDEVILFPARVSPGNTSEPTGFPPELEVELSNDATFTHFQRLGRWQENDSEEASHLPMLRLPAPGGVSGRYLRVRVFGSRIRPSGRGQYFSLGEIVVLQQSKNVALGKSVTSSRSIENAPRWEAGNLTDGFLWCLAFAGAAASPANGFHSGIATESSGPEKWVEIDLGRSQAVEEIRLFPAHPQDFADTAGFGFPPRFRLRGFGDSGEETLLYESSVGSSLNLGAAPLMISIPKTALRRVRFESDDLWQRTDDYLIALSEMQIRGAGENIAFGQPVRAFDEVETGSWNNEALTDGFTSQHDLLSWSEWLDGLSKREAYEKREAVIVSTLEFRAARNRQIWVLTLVGGLVLVLMAALLILLRQRRLSIAAQNQLRQRIAADLHDELGASLSHLALQGELAASELDEATDNAVRARLTRLSDTARTTLNDMRDVIWLLGEGPANWEEFAKRLETIADRLLDGVDHDFCVHGDPPPDRPPIQWAREVVLFLKEALANARRHAAATKISVKLTWSGDFNLLIEDNGTGFDSKTVTHHRRRAGMGLQNLNRRAVHLGGSAKIDSKPEAGTRIHLNLPFPGPNS